MSDEQRTIVFMQAPNICDDGANDRALLSAVDAQGRLPMDRVYGVLETCAQKMKEVVEGFHHEQQRCFVYVSVTRGGTCILPQLVPATDENIGPMKDDRFRQYVANYAMDATLPLCVVDEEKGDAFMGVMTSPWLRTADEQINTV